MKFFNDAFLGFNEVLLDATGTNLAEVGLVEFFAQNPSYAVFMGASVVVGFTVAGKHSALSKKVRAWQPPKWSDYVIPKLDAHFDNLKSELQKAQTEEEYKLAIKKHSNWFSRLVWGLKA